MLVASGLDRRRRTTARLLEAATQVTGDELASVADAERWVRRRVVAAGRSIDAAAARFVAARAGPDLPRLRGEVDRLLLFIGDAPAVSLDDARMVAGPAAAHDDWAVARAIERGQAATALRELALIVESGAAPYLVLGQLAWVVRTRMPNHRIAAAVESLYRTDLDLKSSAGDHRVLLERLRRGALRRVTAGARPLAWEAPIRRLGAASRAGAPPGAGGAVEPPAIPRRRRGGGRAGTCSGRRCCRG